MKIERAFRNERLLKALTGVGIEEFKELEVAFERELNRIEALNRSKDRQRAVGGGRKCTLKSVAEKLFFMLFYLKVYPTFDLAGFIFGADKSNTSRWYKPLLEALEKTLKAKVALPKRKIRSMEEFLQAFPEVQDIFIDGTERRTQRPKSSKTQRRQYSGKKKSHTRKNTIISDERKRILVVSPTKNGKIHDKTQLEKENTLDNIPERVGIWVDRGYEGIEKGKKNCNRTFKPKKKPKGGELKKEKRKKTE